MIGAFRPSRAKAAAAAQPDAFDRRLQTALIESRQRYKDLVEIAGDFAWETDGDGVFVFVSPRGALGYAAAELIGRPAADLLAGTEDDASAFVAREPVENLQLWLRRADGANACLRLSAVPVPAADGTWQGARGICRDVTAARERDAALARADLRERLLGRILRVMRDGSAPDEMLAAVAAETARALGADSCLVLRGGSDTEFAPAADAGVAVPWRDAPLAAAAASDVPVAAGAWLAAATRYRQAVNGAVILHAAPGAASGAAWDAEAVALLASVADHLGIALAQIADHERLYRMARTDGLTGLLNRRTFHEELERRWLRARGETAAGGALIYCDLDNFKLVNDHAGHGAGDEALRGVARILADLTRGQDLVARLGGDEFAVWLEGADRAGAENKAAAVLQAARALAHMSGDPSRPFAVSLGIALVSRGDADLDAFLARADAAMYAAKQAGKGQVAFAETAGERP